MASTEEDRRRRREQARRRRSIGGVVGIVVLLLLVGVVVARATDQGPVEVTADPAGESAYGVTMGPADAPRTIVVYEDFLCPFCGRFDTATFDQLADLAARGEVLVDYRPFSLLRPDYSTEAAGAFKVVLDAAGPEVALDFHAALFAEQPEESGPYPDTDALVDLAVAAGATEADVRPGIQDGAGDDWVEQASEAALATGLQGTPTVLLDGVPFAEGESIEELADNLLAAVSEPG